MELTRFINGGNIVCCKSIFHLIVSAIRKRIIWYVPFAVLILVNIYS